MSEDLIVVERFWVQRNCELLLPILDICSKTFVKIIPQSLSGVEFRVKLNKGSCGSNIN